MWKKHYLEIASTPHLRDTAPAHSTHACIRQSSEAADHEKTLTID